MHTLSQLDANPNEGPVFGLGLDLEILPPAKLSLMVLVSLSLAPVMLLSSLIAIVFYVSRGPVSQRCPRSPLCGYCTHHHVHH